MISPHWLARMSLLARRRPSLTFFLVVMAFILGAILLWGIEQLWGWPDALTIEGGGRRIAPRF
jgi:hypothetical protein